jgi:putative effector of murein hydrolase
MNSVFSSTLYFLFLTLGVYSLFGFIATKIKNPLVNPLLLTSIFIIIYIIILSLIKKTTIGEEVTTYTSAVNILNSMLSPLTICLALPIYTRRHIIKQYWLPILVGTIVGCSVSMGSVFILGKLFGLNSDVIASILPKGVTTAIAIEVSAKLGGIKAITVFVVILSGILGIVFGPLLCKLFKFDRSASIGMAFGGSSHAFGTSKAVEMSIRAGAISSVAIVTSGLLTVFIAMFL